MSADVVHIIGAGAVGTVLATYLSQARRNVQLVVREDELESMAAAQALRVDRVTGRAPVEMPKPAISSQYQFAAGDTVLICVKHRDLETIAGRLEAAEQQALTLVPCLNGVGAATSLRQRFPEAEVAALTVMFNAQLLEPLHARMTTKPEILLNTSNKNLLALFEGSELLLRQAEDESVAWGKLLINLANALCALTHTTFKDLLTDRDMSQCFVATLDEATATLDAASIRYKLPIPLPYSTYRTLLLHGGPLPWWFARFKNGLSESSFPSMVADVEAGKQTEVMQLNGEIVNLAKRHGKQAPINAQLVSMVQDLEGTAQDYFLSPRALRERLEAL